MITRTQRYVNVRVPAELLQKVAGELGEGVLQAILDNHVLPTSATTEQRKNGRGRERKGCSVEGCDKPHSAKGYCANHYQAYRRGTLKVGVTQPDA